MSAIDDVLDNCEGIIRPFDVHAARAELVTLRSTVAEQARQLETARKTIKRIWEMSDNETSKVEIEPTSLMWQIEADTRAWLAENAPVAADEVTITVFDRRNDERIRRSA